MSISCKTSNSRDVEENFVLLELASKQIVTSIDYIFYVDSISACQRANYQEIAEFFCKWSFGKPINDCLPRTLSFLLKT